MAKQNDELKKLRELVNQLESAKGNDVIINKLQEIGEYILKNCYFEFEKGKIIYPLWIEAYYYNAKEFSDSFCHKNAAQKGKENFGKAYYHSGVDVCLSLGDYYLSYLIKVSKDNNGNLYSQTELVDSIKCRSADKVIKISNDRINEKVDKFYRIGLSCNHDMKRLFYQESLLSYYFDNLDTVNYRLETIKNTISKISINKESFVKIYLATHNNVSDKKEITKRILGYSLNSLFDSSGNVIEAEMPLIFEKYNKS